MLTLLMGCNLFEDLDVPNENSPNLAQVFADPQEYFSLLSGSYNTWWNQGMGPSPNLALSTAAEVFTTGFGSWGAAEYYQIPREPLSNVEVSDIVLNPICGAWYSYYGGLTPVNNIIEEIVINGRMVEIGDEDLTQAALAHAYLLQGLLIGHLALVYDKAFLITEETDITTFEYEFTPYPELIDFALERLDRAIGICNNNSFSDPIEMMPGVSFDNVSLGKFANANAARILAASARTAAENLALDWPRIRTYATNGITEDFKVDGEPGWVGLAISRDPFNHVHFSAWDWVRVNQRIINMMAPDDPGAQYPWPQGVPDLPEVNSPDQRMTTDMEYAGRHSRWNPASRGYHILSSYKYIRYFETFGRDGAGELFFFLKAENDLLLAEATVRTAGPSTEVATLVNNTRVGRGALEPLDGSESAEMMIEKIFYERYVELGWTFPLLGFFDRRRTDDLLQGTARQLPVPANELALNGFEFYTFGGFRD